jgi:ACS family sodium-dependent inorganic phosphate cotransporter
MVKFESLSGSSIGAATTYPLFGLLINWFDWPAIYHVTGVIGVIWFIAWWLLVYDSPAQHPRISEKEKTYILNKLGKTVAAEKTRVRVSFVSVHFPHLAIFREKQIFLCA